MRCVECRTKFKQRYFLEKTCSDECEKAYREHTPKVGINQVSDKTAELKKQYLAERVEFLKGKICPVTNKPATEIHHTNGRTYERLIDKEYWLAVTRQGHGYIHANPKEARKNGWLK